MSSELSKFVDVIDCGVGNIRSVEWALSSVGATVRVHQNAETLPISGHLVLPGVGAFRSVRQSLEKGGFIEAIKLHVDSGDPFLGICVGMQLLFDKSCEFGETKGFGFIEGSVKPMPRSCGRVATKGIDQFSLSGVHKLPYVNWSSLLPSSSARWEQSILNGLKLETEVYFTHSMEAKCARDADITSYAAHDGYLVCAAVNKNNIYGTQFHPEKSGPCGLKILYNFLGQ